MFFSTVCLSCKGFKCVTQKLEDPKNSRKFVRPKKDSGNFAKPRKIAKKLPTQKNMIWLNFKPKEIERASLSKF